MNKIEIHNDIVYNSKSKKDITLIHLGDIHFNITTNIKKLDKIKEAIYKNNPDYVVITGDTIDNPQVTKDKIRIKKLLLFLTDISNFTKVIISLGNHDVYIKEHHKFFQNLNDLKNIYILDNEAYIDEEIYISGFTLPATYYYNITRNESKEALIEHLKKNKKLTYNLPLKLPKVGLIHSPILLTDKDVLTQLNEYDLLLSGHTHGGMVPKFLSKFFKKNQGIIAPNKKILPEVARGKIENYIKDKKITLIITSGITKLSLHSAKILNKLNFVYNIDINKIIITSKKGRY